MADFNIDDALNELSGSPTKAVAPTAAPAAQPFNIESALSELNGSPSQTSDSSREPMSKAESAALGVGKGVTAGFLPQLGGIIGGAAKNVSNTYDDYMMGRYKDALLGRADGTNLARGGNGNISTSPTYIGARDALKDLSTQSAQDNPGVDMAGQAVGSLIPAGTLLKGVRGAGLVNKFAAPVVASALHGGTLDVANGGNGVGGAITGAALGALPGAAVAAGKGINGLNNLLKKPAQAVVDMAESKLPEPIIRAGKEYVGKAADILADKTKIPAGLLQKGKEVVEDTVSQPMSAIVNKIGDLGNKTGIYPNNIGKITDTVKSIATDPLEHGKQLLGQVAGQATRHGINHAVTGGIPMLAPVTRQLDKVAKPVGEFVEAGVPKAIDAAGAASQTNTAYAPLQEWLSPQNRELNESTKRKDAMDNQAVKKSD